MSALLTVFSIFSGPYAVLARLGVVGIAAAALFGFGWFKGDEHGTEKLTTYQAEEAVAAVKLQAARVKVVTEVQTKYVDRIKTVEVAGLTITKEVTKYVTQTDDSRCVVPVGFVRSFDAAWSGTPAGPPAESDRQPSGLPLSVVGEVEAGNAASCLVYREQRDGLIEFYRRIQALER